MQVRWLGWAGVEIEHDGETVVIDPLADPAATFAGVRRGGARGRAAAGGARRGPARRRPRDPPAPRPHRRGRARRVARARRRGPPPRPADDERPRHGPGRARARGRRAAAPPGRGLGVGRRSARSPAPRSRPSTGSATRRSPGSSRRGGQRVLHLGDTVFHGAWWQMARRAGPFDVVLAPVNGAVVDFPHQQPPSPLPAAMEPEQAALAGELLGAATVVPMHYGGFAFEPHYRADRRRARALRARRARASVPRGAARTRRDALTEGAASSGLQHPAVDDELGAGRARRARRAQERDRVGDLLRLDQPPGRQLHHLRRHRRDHAVAIRARRRREDVGGPALVGPPRGDAPARGRPC